MNQAPPWPAEKRPRREGEGPPPEAITHRKLGCLKARGTQPLTVRPNSHELNDTPETPLSWPQDGSLSHFKKTRLYSQDPGNHSNY